MCRIATFLATIIITANLGASVLSVDFSTLPEWMNPKFYATLWDHNRFNVWVGGAGSGKSVGASQRDAYRLTAEPGHNYMILRKVGESNRYSTFADLVNKIDTWHLTPLYDISESALTIRNKCNGNEVIFRGMNDIRAREHAKSVTFKSGPLTDIRLEEASEFEPEDFRQLNLRLRGQARQPFQMTLTFNPISVSHWLKAEFFDNAKPNATILRSTYLDNQWIDEDYKAELEALRLSDPTMYQVYALGEWGELGDAAFPNVVYEPCPYKPEDFDQVLWGHDFGFQHFDATEGIGVKDGELYSFRELYVRQLVNSGVIAAAGPIVGKHELQRGDSAEPKTILEWQQAGYNMVGVNKSGRPDFVKSGFAYLRGHRWHIDPEACPGLAAEVRGAVYKKDKNGQPTEEIFSFRNDALAAARYAVDELIQPATKWGFI
jgi:phage terminase large subunit